MIGYRFEHNAFGINSKDPFLRLFKIFSELLLYTAGDVDEALQWLTQLDKEYNISSEIFGIADFIRQLEEFEYISFDSDNKLRYMPTAKLEISMRKNAYEDLFGKIKWSKGGRHTTQKNGRGDEQSSNTKAFEFGDKPENISVSDSIRNAQINHGIDDFHLSEGDLVLQETFYQSQMSTVVMIDISHSMILYGEDRITPAKKVALALAEIIRTQFPKDTLDIIVFGDEAWQIELKDLPYLVVGPYHTNTVAGLELAAQILKKRNNPNKQIFMITDGKPTAIKKGKKLYKNSYGLDRLIINRTINMGIQLRKMGVSVTTFMIASDPLLVEFVRQFSEANKGKAYFSGIDGLGNFFLDSYMAGKKRK